MEDCDICYFSQSPDCFYQLDCCKNNKVCTGCIDLLTVALCPFCRKIIPNLENKQTSISCSTDMSDLEYYSRLYNTTYTNNIDNTDANINYQYYLINPLDDYYADSRILRRHIRRMRKLEQREHDAIYNKNLNKSLNSYNNKSNKSKNKKNIQDNIKSDLEMLQFNIDEYNDYEN